MSAFPPIRTQKGLNVTPDTALLYLSAYLTSSKTSPHLLPNARLEASGPTAGSSNASVTIHNLQRVEAGLKGEWLAPKLELEEDEQVKEVTKLTGTAETAEEGWMDLDQYQREQRVEGPEMAQDELGVEDDGDVEETAQVDFYGSGAEDGDVVMDEVKAVAAPPKKIKTKVAKELNPEARKKAKKDRLKEEKRAKEEQRKQKSQKDA